MVSAAETSEVPVDMKDGAEERSNTLKTIPASNLADGASAPAVAVSVTATARAGDYGSSETGSWHCIGRTPRKAWAEGVDLDPHSRPDSSTWPSFSELYCGLLSPVALVLTRSKLTSCPPVSNAIKSSALMIDRMDAGSKCSCRNTLRGHYKVIPVWTPFRLPGSIVASMIPLLSHAVHTACCACRDRGQRHRRKVAPHHA